MQKIGVPFQQIKALVREKVRTRAWHIGERIPSEAELATVFGVARMTVNRALRELTEEGMLERVTGVGTFVADEKPQSNLLMIAHIRDEIISRGHEYSYKTVSQGHENAPLDITRAFGVAPDDQVFHLVCIHMDNGRPLQLEERYVNPRIVPEFLAQDFTQTPPSEYLYNNVSHDELEIEHIVDAARPSQKQAQLLEIETGEPCLILTRRTWTGSVPVTVVKFVHPANRYSLGSRFKPPSLRGQI
jgi:GntR family transcriptional regulator, histidine utilization repressor